MTSVEERLAALDAHVSQLHFDFAITKTQVETMMKKQKDEEMEWKDKVEASFARHGNMMDDQRQNMSTEMASAKQAIDTVVESAKTQFNNIQSEFQQAKMLMDQTAEHSAKLEAGMRKLEIYIDEQHASINFEFTKEVMEIKAKLEVMECGGGGGLVQARIQALEERIQRAEAGGSGRTGGTMNGFLPLKMSMPKKLSLKLEVWRHWKVDFLDFLDAQRPGIKDYLKEIGACKDPTLEQFIRNKGNAFDDHVRKDVWRALKELTEDDVRRIVETAAEEDGYEGWRSMCQYFEPALSAQQTAAMSDLMLMIRRKPVNNIQETKALMLEFATKVRIVEAISDEGVPDKTLSGILAVIIDDETRKHTTHFQGEGKSAENFKRAIIDFVNTASTQATTMNSANNGSDGRGPAPMQVNPLAWSNVPNYTINTGSSSSGESNGSWECWDCWGNYDPNANNAEAKPETNTNVPQTADEIQYALAMKGKGKGKSKGPCWTCGKMGHQSRDCWQHLAHAGGGKYGGKGGLPMMKGQPAVAAPFMKGVGKGSGKSQVEARQCYNCHGYGRIARNCPRPQASAGTQQIRALCGFQAIEPKCSVENRFEALRDDTDLPAEEAQPAETPKTTKSPHRDARRRILPWEVPDVTIEPGQALELVDSDDEDEQFPELNNVPMPKKRKGHVSKPCVFRANLSACELDRTPCTHEQ